MMNKQECILFYVKFPERGKVKTRLAKDIGDKHALELYKCFVFDILDTLDTLSQTVCICYTPDNSELVFKSWLGEMYRYFPQQGHDLGERMENSFKQVFQDGFERAVLIGSDLPDLPSHLLSMAFEQLHAGDSVIGPADDGGYYLIGFQKETFFPEVFQGITWSQPSVYTETVKKFDSYDKKFSVLSVWNDIDNIEELQQWYKQNQSNTTYAVRTITYLQQIEGLKIDTH